MYTMKKTYKDFAGVERTKTLYFNLTEADITKMNFSADGSLAERIQRISDSKDMGEIYNMFEQLVDASYGERSDDGQYHDKSEEVLRKFRSSAVRSDVIMDLVTDPEAAKNFVNGIIPANLAERAQARSAKISALPNA